MKTFHCHCGNTIYFENSRCLACGRDLGFLPDALVLSAIEPAGEEEGGNPGAVRPLAPEGHGRLYRRCSNYAEEGVCNWLLLAADPQPRCPSCRLNRVIPDLSEPRNRVLWARIETAKRRLLYTLFALGLPVVGQDRDPRSGLAFAFLADAPAGTEFTDSMGRERRVLTGHEQGLITINLAEADDPKRERIRERMNELYRTLLGHFRHESGHFYWQRLVAGGPFHEDFRTLFGDERADYSQALDRHYTEGPSPHWAQDHISAYASAHPWEDWAETWAHYLHMTDTLETADDHGLRLNGQPVQAPAPGMDPEFAVFLRDWTQVAAALNDLNRSMGLPDAYPFYPSAKATEKLAFVHRVIRSSAVAGRLAPIRNWATP
jgi:hypothetical protein